MLSTRATEDADPAPPCVLVCVQAVAFARGLRLAAAGLRIFVAAPRALPLDEAPAAADEHTGKVLVFSAIDNLWKGTSSQAVQNLNLMYGLPETTGLA